MAQQIYSASSIENFAVAFPRRNEASYAWGNAASIYQQLPGLRGYWPLGPSKTDGVDVWAVDVACDYHLELVNSPNFSVYGGITQYMDFIAASSQYLTYADDPQFDILGNENYIAYPGLTIGAWVWFDAPSIGAAAGIVSKYNTVGNQRAYSLRKLAAGDTPTFVISTDGINLTSVVSSVSAAVNTWYFICGGFVPSTTLDVFVNTTKSTNNVAIPATVFNSNDALEVGRFVGASYLDGRISQLFITASALSDTQINALYWQTRPLFFGT